MPLAQGQVLLKIFVGPWWGRGKSWKRMWNLTSQPLTVLYFDLLIDPEAIKKCIKRCQKGVKNSCKWQLYRALYHTSALHCTSLLREIDIMKTFISGVLFVADHVFPVYYSWCSVDCGTCWLPWWENTYLRVAETEKEWTTTGELMFKVHIKCKCTATLVTFVL